MLGVVGEGVDIGEVLDVVVVSADDVNTDEECSDNLGLVFPRISSIRNEE